MQNYLLKSILSNLILHGAGVTQFNDFYYLLKSRILHQKWFNLIRNIEIGSALSWCRNRWKIS